MDTGSEIATILLQLQELQDRVVDLHDDLSSCLSALVVLEKALAKEKGNHKPKDEFISKLIAGVN